MKSKDQVILKIYCVKESNTMTGSENLGAKTQKLDC